jgi:hypothetical protein
MTETREFPAAMLIEHTPTKTKITDERGHTYARNKSGEWLYRGIGRRLWCPVEECDVPAAFKDALAALTKSSLVPDEPMTHIERIHCALAMCDAGYNWEPPSQEEIEALLLAHDSLSVRHKILLESCQSAASSG